MSKLMQRTKHFFAQYGKNNDTRKDGAFVSKFQEHVFDDELTSHFDE